MEEVHNENQDKQINGLSGLRRSISLTGVKIPMRQCSNFQMKLAPYLLNQPYARNVIPDTENSLDKRVVLLKENVNKDLEGIPEEIKNWINQAKDTGAEVITYDLDVDYKSYSLEQILGELLPVGVSRTLKQESLKEIKILDLTADQLPYKEFIGKIVLEKSPLTKTILLRTQYKDESNPLSKYFQTSKYELLCGEPNTEIEIVEGPCKYKVDLLKTYYDSTDQEERGRILQLKADQNTLCDLSGDLFYSISAARAKNLSITANCHGDNQLFEVFSENIKLNGVESLIDLKNENIYTFLQKYLLKEYGKTNYHTNLHHIYLADYLEDISFLKIFVGLFNAVKVPEPENETCLPFVHFYMYLNNDEITESLKVVLTKKLNVILNDSFANKDIQDILDKDDFDIFIFKSEDSSRKLIQCTWKLSKKLLYCPESLFSQVLTIPDTMEVEEEEEKTEDKIEEEAKEEGTQKEGAKRKSAKQSSKKSAPKKEKAEPTPKKEKTEATPKKAKATKPPVSAEELEAEVNAEEGGLRRSSRKKSKPKQMEEFDYPAVKSQRESSR